MLEALSDRGTLRGLTQFPRSRSHARVELTDCKEDPRKASEVTDVCDNQCVTARKSLILNGEMSEC